MTKQNNRHKGGFFVTKINNTDAGWTRVARKRQRCEDAHKAILLRGDNIQRCHNTHHNTTDVISISGAGWSSPARDRESRKAEAAQNKKLLPGLPRIKH
ncbi:MAG: hypothetical protein CMF31_00985 [Kordiimonas sp.]|nr:hypothetical protein [Kordiimonas sp.]|tara:strand:+ start:406 stop:702 length:297 start_codon:yes stop_codon:yes gene_type:complete